MARVLLVFGLIFCASFCTAQDGQPMRFETPKMNEEEQHSMHIPGSFEMQCDACTAVAFQVWDYEYDFVLITLNRVV